MVKPPAFVCPHCDRPSTTKGALRKHIQNIHKLDLPLQRKYDCDECSEVLCSLNRLKRHYEEAHNYRPVYEERRFRTMAAFKTWKQKMESETGSRFIAQSAAKKSPLSRGKVLYLACCRSGHFKSHSTGKRKLKSQGSVKCGRRCFASMTVVEKETGVSVVFQATHRGHDLDLRHVLISDKEKTAIASKLHKGVSLDAVLDSVRERFEGALQRVHLLARQDLNVLADSRPESSRGAAAAGGEGDAEAAALAAAGEVEDECLGVLAWVERMGREEDNPVLYFKQRGQPDCAEVLERQPEDVLADDDFMLVLMTHPQLELLRALDGRRVCIDWTHGAPGLDLQLLTLVCLDGGGGAFPVAFCVTGQVERRSALTFLRCVAAAHGGPVQAEVLVADDVPALFSAWQEVMGQPRHCLLCSWAVDRAWRENIKRRIPHKKLQAFAYKALQTVMDASTESRVEELQEAFSTWCSLEGPKRRVLTDFMDYFQQNFAHRPEVWATCYRRGAGLGSSVRLEALHKVLEHCCLRGGENQRVDQLVPLLLRLTRNKVIDRLAKFNPSAEADFRAETKKRHEAGLKIPREYVSCAGIGQWTVRSPSDIGDSYVVACQGEPCREACSFACPACQVCAHNTICSCPDSELRRNICPHIHAVFARTVEAMDVVEESLLRTCGVDSTAEEDAGGGGNQSEKPSSDVAQPPAGDGKPPTVCALLLHAIGQQLQHPCVQEKATPWLQPLLAAILERLNACAATHRVALSYVVNNNGVLASTDAPHNPGGPQLSDGDVTRAVLSIGQPTPPADRPAAAPAVVVRTVEPPLATNHRPILPAVKKVAETAVAANVAAPPAMDAAAAQTILVGIAEPPSQGATHTVPQPAGSAGHPATQTIFVKVAGPLPVPANQEAVQPALVKVPASTASVSHEATRTVFVPAAPAAAPLATPNIFVRTAEPPVLPSDKVVHPVSTGMARPAGSLDHLTAGTVLAGLSEPPPSSASEAACPVLSKASAAAVTGEATDTAPARIAQLAHPAGHPAAQTIFLMGPPPQAKGDEVVCLVPLEMAEAMAANRKAARTFLPGGAKPPVPANHLAAHTSLARMAEPAVSENRQVVHTVPATLPKPVLSVGQEDTHTVFVLSDSRVSANHEARHAVPARIPHSPVPVDHESTRGVFVLSEPQVSTSRGSRHGNPAGIPASAASVGHEDTRTMFVLAEPPVSTSCGTKNSVSATTPKPPVSVDHEDTRTVFVLAQPPVSSGHQATPSVPTGILRPEVSASHEDTRTVFVLAEPEGPTHEARFTAPARIPKSALPLDRDATTRLSAHDTKKSVPTRIPKPAVAVDHEGASTVFVLAQPPGSTSQEHGVPAKMPRLSLPLDHDDTRTVFVLAQPQMSTNLEAMAAATAGPALPLDHEGSHVILVPVAEPPASANHQASCSTRASVVGLQLSPGHEAAHTILTMATPVKPPGRKTVRSILKATRPPVQAGHETVPSTPAGLAEAAPRTSHTAGTRVLASTADPAASESSQAGGFAFGRVAESPASDSVSAKAAEPQLSPNSEAAHAILKMADPPSAPAGHEAPLPAAVDAAGSPAPAGQGAALGASATCRAPAATGKPDLSPSREPAPRTVLGAGDPVTLADQEEVTAGSPVPAGGNEAGPSLAVKVEEPEAPSSPEATDDGIFAIALDQDGTSFIFVRTAESPVSAAHDDGPVGILEGTAVQAALGEEDDAPAAPSAPCNLAATDHDYCTSLPSQASAGFTTAFPWTTNLVQHFPSSR